MKAIIVASLVLVGCGDIGANAKVGGTVTTKSEVVVRFPAAEMCFTDQRIKTYDDLQACLDAVTGYSVDIPEEATALCSFLEACDP